jgi:hypothetical protein
MYLTRLDPKTGLVVIEDNDDGVLAIKAFRDVINDPDLGVGCFTAIALTADYLSIKRNYNEEDRPRAAMEEVSGNRNKWVWNQEKIQVALVKYKELQYDPDIEEGEIHYQRKINKLVEFKKAEEYHSKPRSKDDKELSFKSPSTIAAELRKINEDIEKYKKNIQGKELYDNSPVKQGYTLSRLEQLVQKKNSFYKEKR